MCPTALTVPDTCGCQSDPRNDIRVSSMMWLIMIMQCSHPYSPVLTSREPFKHQARAVSIWTPQVYADSRPQSSAEENGTGTRIISALMRAL
ncbi:hypothetical protein HBI56_218290 [Parastagonospora nodorum]|nr:hypothetical protein HBH56_225770 [Parastagonospora nodorum]KAH3935529.1 hypothetical protein HBH54_032960 [Parastagonospora nodorum]KAH3940027.1 hypothetical protein HBH53_223810 [Parastagonospora nodorum]KAH3957611.1 hypothetical protein HBH51_222900 [Parastagonospora nodorum]KAH3988739.1 hypothetical protein HBH52_022130 [Parastagonospora nodorum]